MDRPRLNKFNHKPNHMQGSPHRTYHSHNQPAYPVSPQVTYPVGPPQVDYSVQSPPQVAYPIQGPQVAYPVQGPPQVAYPIHNSSDRSYNNSNDNYYQHKFTKNPYHNNQSTDHYNNNTNRHRPVYQNYNHQQQHQQPHYHKNYNQNQPPYPRYHNKDNYNGNQSSHTNAPYGAPYNGNSALSHIKSLLARYINKNVSFATFKYTMAEYKYDLEQLSTAKYFTSPNYNGNLCLVVFVKIQNKYYAYSVDKKTLSKNIQNNIDEINISKLNIRVDESLYNGTILDCTQLNTGNNLQKIFMINDVYLFRGDNIVEDNIDNKLLNVDTYMKMVHKDDVFNDTSFITNKLYDLSEIKELISVYIPKSQLKNYIKGVTFYAQQNHTKIIYLFNNCAKTEKTEKSEQKKLVIRNPNIDSKDGDVTAHFRIKKTETPDVYHLYLKKKGIRDGKKIIRLKKYCIAYLPTTSTSYFCKDIFNDIDTDSDDLVIVKCKYCVDKNKWIPFEHAKDKKYPDYYKDIESKYGLAERGTAKSDDASI